MTDSTQKYYLTEEASKRDKNYLKKRFFNISITISLFIISLGSFVFFLSMQKIIYNNKANELSKMMEINTSQMGAYVKSEKNLAERLAHSPMIRQHFLFPQNTIIKKQVFEEMQSYRNIFSNSSVFWVSDKDRLFYSDDNQAFKIDVDSPENYWYNLTLYETDGYNYNINYNQDLNQIRLWINFPVFDDNGKPIGMVGTGMDLSDFFDPLFVNVGDTTQLYFFNARGEITGVDHKNLTSMNDLVDLHNSKRSIEIELGDIAFGIVDRAKLIGREETYTFKSKKNIIAIRPVPALDWYSIAFTPINIGDYFKHSMTWLFIIVLLVIVTMVFIFNLFVIRFNNKLNNTMESLEIASNTKSEFLASMSHEIRTPMNAIVGMTELALNKELPAPVRENIYTIKQASASLLAIINDILDFSKIETGKLEIVPDRYLLTSMLNDVISIARMKVFDSEISFTVNVDSSLPNSLLGDELRIRQVLLNVLSNAIKYTAKGYVSFVILGELSDGDNVKLTFEIADSGMGIKQEDLEKIFDGFVQTDLVKNKGIEGTGLGLPIALKLIKAMGGDISVRSEYGTGSTFTIVLQQQIEHPDKLAVVDNPGQKRVLVYETRQFFADSIVCSIDNLGVDCTLVSDDLAFQKKLSSGVYAFAFIATTLYENVKEICKKFESSVSVVLLAGFGEVVANQTLAILYMPVQSISVADVLNGESNSFSYSENLESSISFVAPDAHVLVVDDVDTNLNVAKGLLSLYEVQTTLCNSGVEAIETLASRKFDFVLMDHMMPEMDGIETTKRIRAMGDSDPYFKNLPIIALTANAVVGTRELFLANGFDDFLSKPVDMAKLNATLAKWTPREKQNKPNLKTPLKSSTGLGLTIGGLDDRKGIANTGGTVEGFIKTLNVFVSDGQKKAEEIKACLVKGDLNLYTIYVHALKSSAACIGADKLSAGAEALEAAGNAKDMGFIQEYTSKLLTDLECLIANINNTLGFGLGAGDSTIESAELVQGLSGLKVAIEGMDLRGIRVATRNLDPYCSNPKIGADVKTILSNTLVGDYDHAISLIDTLLSGFQSMLKLK